MKLVCAVQTPPSFARRTVITTVKPEVAFPIDRRQVATPFAAVGPPSHPVVVVLNSQLEVIVAAAGLPFTQVKTAVSVICEFFVGVGLLTEAVAVQLSAVLVAVGGIGVGALVGAAVGGAVVALGGTAVGGTVRAAVGGAVGAGVGGDPVGAVVGDVTASVGAVVASDEF